MIHVQKRPFLQKFPSIVLLSLLVSSCGITEYDHYFTFVSHEAAKYQIPMETKPGLDVGFSVPIHVDTSVYSTQHTRPDLLGTSYISHLVLSSLTSSFKLSALDRIVFIAGTDTVVDQGKSGFAADTLSLNVRQVDITRDLRDTAYVGHLIVRLASAPAQDIQLGVTITVSQTALPIAD